jgi:ankyrin repeat protein
MKKHFQLIVFAIFCAALSGPAMAQTGSFERFFMAISRDHVGPIIELQLRGFDINAPNPDLVPPLVLAIQTDSLRVARHLVEQPGLNLEARNPAGETALMLAAIRGHLDLVQRLLERRAQVNQPGWTPLHYAASHDGEQALPITQLLLERHAFIDARSPNGSTPLMLAAHYGRREVVELLLREGAEPLARNQQGLNAIDFAMLARRADVAEAIAAHVRAQQGSGTW